MRTLKFNVNKQLIEQDPNCDFEGLVPGTEGYLQAEFTFSSEWNGCVKVAGFISGVQEYPVKLENNRCTIPAQVLTERVFGVRVLGKRDTLKLVSNTVKVAQLGEGGIS